MVFHKRASYRDFSRVWIGIPSACGRFLEYPVENIRRCWKHVTCKACLKNKPK